MKSSGGAYLVFQSDDCGARVIEPDGDPRFVLWQPRPWRLRPPTTYWKTSLWSLAHYLRVFRNRDYAVLLILQDDKVVHRSSVIPACFRWPFMNDLDLHVSDTWTEPGFRGQGLATTALRRLLALFRRPGRRFWYVTRIGNPSSVVVCQNVGFSFVGMANRRYRWGSRLLGTLELDPDTLSDNKDRKVA